MSNLKFKEIEVEANLDAIHHVFMQAYAVEASLLGVSDFPPLNRSKTDLLDSKNQFFGCFDEALLCGVLELETDATPQATIASLAVHPQQFRRGVATVLVNGTLLMCAAGVRVSTGQANAPALELYDRLGFSEIQRFMTSDRVAMVELYYHQTTME